MRTNLVAYNINLDSVATPETSIPKSVEIWRDSDKV